MAGDHQIVASAGRRLCFTLVELLIVVVVLSILATVVISQFSDPGEDARLASLQSNLSVIRNQIRLYMVQHNGRTPAEMETGSLQPGKFTIRLLERTDSAGKLISSGTCGPYLRSWPNNSFNDKKQVRVGAPAAGAGTAGWHFEPTTAVFSADDSPAHAGL